MNGQEGRGSGGTKDGKLSWGSHKGLVCPAKGQEVSPAELEQLSKVFKRSDVIKAMF